MAFEDSTLKSDSSHFLEPMTCGAENLSPYSNTSGYSDTQNYFASEFDWSQQHQQQQQSEHHHHHPHQQPQHIQARSIHESDLRYYGTFTDSLELSPAAASGFSNFSTQQHHHQQHHPHHHLPHHQSDYFPNNPAIWNVGQGSDPISGAPNPMSNPHSRFFSGIDLSQQVGGSPQMSQGSLSSGGKPKRKRVQSHSQRKAANVRERRRMFHLNEAFDELRKRLPAFNYEKRLSRIETLRLAMTYISFMKDVSVGHDPKRVKLKPHGSESDLQLALASAGLGLSQSPYSNGLESPDNGTALDSDESCSNDNMTHILQCS